MSQYIPECDDEIANMAVRDAREIVLPRVVDLVIGAMGGVYPELVERKGVIARVVPEEEGRFRETLERGVRLFDEETKQLSAKSVPGDLELPLDGGLALVIRKVCGKSPAAEELARLAQRTQCDFD